MTGAFTPKNCGCADYDLDQSALSAFFQLENMIAAAFYCAERLFGLRFVPRPDLPAYHPDVRVFEVLDREGRHVAIFIGDYYARTGEEVRRMDVEFSRSAKIRRARCDRSSSM